LGIFNDDNQVEDETGNEGGKCSSFILEQGKIYMVILVVGCLHGQHELILMSMSAWKPGNLSC